MFLKKMGNDFIRNYEYDINLNNFSFHLLGITMRNVTLMVNYNRAVNKHA